MSKRKILTEKAEATGLRVVNQIVREWWLCRFQEFESRNDDGIDGLIILKKKGIVSGEIIHCQIKSGKGYRKSYKDRLGIGLGIKYLKEHRPRWNNIIGLVILIYVEEPKSNKEMPNVWWVNLKSEEAFSDKAKSIVFIPKEQKFGEHTIGELKKLCGTRHIDYKLPEIRLIRNDVTLFNFKDPMKIQARKYYLNWSKEEAIGERINPVLGEIIINRVGWKHLTRKGRKVERILQSFSLLGVAKKMIQTLKEPEIFGHTKNISQGPVCIYYDYIGLRAFVIFPHRYESTVTVVFKRKRVVDENNGKELERKIWFLSVYESRRGRTKNYYKRNKIKNATVG